MNIKNTILRLTVLSSVLLASSAYAATHKVMIEGMKFSPAAIDVAVGDTITFTNMDGAPHTATAKDGAFDTGRLSKGQSADVKISSAGVVNYFCAVHPSMKAEVSAK